MNSININQLQDQASKIIRQAESGEIIEVVRYSTPVAYLVSKAEYERLAGQTECKECVQDLRAIAQQARITNLEARNNKALNSKSLNI